ncbi:MAG: hypothetical protein O7A69_12955 [SAR324 cluster bacterium]|nr:hypothetical protein [SAR324 cluster bacterium]
MTNKHMNRQPGNIVPAKGYGAKHSPVLRMLGLAVLAWLGSAGCATFGLPDFPVEMRYPPRVEGALFVVYDPDAVLGFGHTGLILQDPGRGLYLRYDQYASSEIAYGRRVHKGTQRFWQVVTSRLPAIFGATKEVVTRRDGASPAALVAPGELLVPVPERGMDREAVLEAAEKRFQAASRLEQQSAPDYYLLTNSCQQFLSAVLGAGGPIPDHYFPKYFVTRYLERYRASQTSR